MTDKREAEERLEQVAVEQSQQVNAHLSLCHTQYWYPLWTPKQDAVRFDSWDNGRKRK